VSDAADLRELTERYARAVDRRRPGDVAALFSPEGVLRIEHPGRAPTELRGRAAIERALDRLDSYRVTTHVLAQQIVDELDARAGRAAAETYCMAHHIRDGPPPYDHLMAVRYLDRFERGEGRWLFAERHLVVDWTADIPVNE